VANFSLGGSLASVPVVAGALALLGISQRRLPVHQLIGVLKGPWLGAGEGDYRALAASRIASKRRGDMTLGGLLRELKGARQPLPATILLLEAWLRHLEGDGSSRRPSDWAQRFNDLLTILGWPGDLPQDSHAHQAASRWSALLAEFAGLDLVSGPIRRDEAVGRVAAMAARTVFQPKGDPGAVQVMGVLEAAGMGFDHLWLMGFGDHLWPPAAAPNPFLPRALQRSLGMPRADAPAELAYARQVTGRLLAAAPERVVSYPLMSDGAEVSVSPLLRHAQPITTDLDDALGLGPDVSHLHQLAVAGVLDVLQDFSGPALVDGGGAGGVSLFADQAACPFKAFASHRLGGRLDEEAGPGLDASGRGSLVHRALELLWPQLGGSEGLKNATESGDLAEKIATVVADAVSEACQGTGLSDGFARLERQRVATLVAEWLEVEGKRAPFTVTAVEQQAKARAGGVTVSTKIDRVDVLSDGSEVLIDYKTGVARFTDWFGERPDAPQLPLYLTMRATPVAALAFAIIRRGEARFSGLGAEDELLPDVKGVASAKLPEGAAEDWESVRREWQRVLHELGTAFVAGDARVDPKDDGACRYCHLDPLCRVWERDMLPQGDAS
jgi:probable DNA repair protein